MMAKVEVGPRRGKICIMNQTPIDNALAGPLIGGSHEPTFAGAASFMPQFSIGFGASSTPGIGFGAASAYAPLAPASASFAFAG